VHAPVGCALGQEPHVQVSPPAVKPPQVQVCLPPSTLYVHGGNAPQAKPPPVHVDPLVGSVVGQLAQVVQFQVSPMAPRPKQSQTSLP
jgi:hypothetical protein